VRIAVVVAQSSLAVRRYIEETGLPFDILIDETRDVARSYGVWHAWGLDAYNIARPALFLIDRSSAIRYSFVASRQSEFPSHEEIMGAISSMLNAQ
jgi:methyl-accepting chemotaxis protein